MQRFIVGLLLALSSLGAYAQAIEEYRAKNGVWTQIVSGWHRTREAAAAELMGLLDGYAATLTVTCIQNQRSGTRIYGHAVSGYHTTGGYPTQFGRLNDTTSSTQNCNLLTRTQGPYSISYDTREASCPVGYFFERTFFSSWARSSTPNASDLFGEVPLPFNYCDGSCQATMDDVIVCERDTSPSPAGNYEVTCTYRYRTTGAVCTTPTQDPQPSPEPPPPDPGEGDPGGDPGGGDPGGGDPGDGGPDPDGDPTCGGTDQPACEPGEGDGTGGDGGTDNGGGTGGGDPGEGENPEPTCGSGTLPPCTVKVDETGTPTSTGILGTGPGSVDQQAQTGIDGLRAKADEILESNHAPTWTWTFQLPTGCTPYNMPAFNLSIDMCQYQPMIHSIMSILWLMATVAALVGMFFKASE